MPLKNFKTKELLRTAKDQVIQGFPATGTTVLSGRYSLGQNCCTSLLLWQGAPSCIKIVQLCILMCSTSFSLSSSTYLKPFILLPGAKIEASSTICCPGPPNHLTGGCFAVRMMNFFVYRAPGGLQIRYFRAENCFIEDSSENRTFFYISVS